MKGAQITETSASTSDINQAQHDAFKVMALFRAFMAYGHLEADLDPLNLTNIQTDKDLGSKYAQPTK